MKPRRRGGPPQVSRRRGWVGQPESYRVVRWVSTSKRACIYEYRFNSRIAGDTQKLKLSLSATLINGRLFVEVKLPEEVKRCVRTQWSDSFVTAKSESRSPGEAV